MRKEENEQRLENRLEPLMGGRSVQDDPEKRLSTRVHLRRGIVQGPEHDCVEEIDVCEKVSRYSGELPQARLADELTRVRQHLDRERARAREWLRGGNGVEGDIDELARGGIIKQLCDLERIEDEPWLSQRLWPATLCALEQEKHCRKRGEALPHLLVQRKRVAVKLLEEDEKGRHDAVHVHNTWVAQHHVFEHAKEALGEQ